MPSVETLGPTAVDGPIMPSTLTCSATHDVRPKNWTNELRAGVGAIKARFRELCNEDGTGGRREQGRPPTLFFLCDASCEIAMWSSDWPNATGTTAVESRPASHAVCLFRTLRSPVANVARLPFHGSCGRSVRNRHTRRNASND